MILLPPVPDQHCRTFFRLFSASMPQPAVDALVEVLGVDFFFVLSALAGNRVHFPKIAALSSFSQRAQIYDLVDARLRSGVDEGEAMRQVAVETGCHYHRVSKAFHSVEKILGTARG